MAGDDEALCVVVDKVVAVAGEDRLVVDVIVEVLVVLVKAVDVGVDVKGIEEDVIGIFNVRLTKAVEGAELHPANPITTMQETKISNNHSFFLGII
jgi:hypothetical protein